MDLGAFPRSGLVGMQPDMQSAEAREKCVEHMKRRPTWTAGLHRQQSVSLAAFSTSHILGVSDAVPAGTDLAGLT